MVFDEFRVPQGFGAEQPNESANAAPVEQRPYGFDPVRVYITRHALLG